MSKELAIEEGIFTWPSDDPRLIGSECTECGNVTFPRARGCAKCSCAEMKDRELGTRGTLWTWTVQAFPPPSPPYAGETDPEKFQPYGVGYVELPGECKVVARLTEADPEKLRIGMEMEMITVPICKNEDGDTLVTFAFQPAA